MIELILSQNTPQIQKLGSLGLMGILVPERYGGGDLNTVSLTVAVEEISRCALIIATGDLVEHCFNIVQLIIHPEVVPEPAR